MWKVLSISFLFFCSSVFSALPLPDPITHGAFLLNEYDPQKPTLIAFKDPRCPYCVKALDKAERLDNYNVYLFWAPILSQRSERQVERFFFCDSPVSAKVIDSVIDRKVGPACEQAFDSNNFEVNNQIVAQYQPNSVPQYWFGGRRVALSQLNLSLSKSQKLKLFAKQSPLKVPWDRYLEFKVTPGQQTLNLALVTDNKQQLAEIQNTLPSLKNASWYLFDSNSPNKRVKEFLALTGVGSDTHPVVLLEGRQLSAKEMKTLLPRELLSIISST